ncbi:NHL repeat-containing protein [Massilia sp. TWP1-3-3]|uniref:NHL repeat-containing protein n=1 Tax=Massilia sp. TWP1-3-3 TaxID=2804573 RepID=UPI003CF55CF7
MKKTRLAAAGVVLAITAAILVAAAVVAVFGAPRWLIGTAGQAPGARLAGKPAATTMGWPATVSDVAGGFADPFGVALDRQGNVYVADAGEHNRIARVGLDGQVTILAGGREGRSDGSGAAAAFHTPSGVAFDPAGNLIVADTGNNAIRKVTMQGVVTTLAGDGTAGFRDGAARQAQFNAPIGVALDKAGNVYVTDTYNDRIRRIGVDGLVSTVAGSGVPGALDGPAASAMFDTPTGIAIDAAGALYVADTRFGAIRRISADGMVETLVRSVPDVDDPLLRRPLALAVTGDGFVYVGDMSRGRILQVAPGGQLVGLTGIGIDIAIGDAKSVRFARPAGMAIDREGALYVSDALNGVLRKVAPRGVQSAARPVPASVVTASATPAAGAATTPAVFPWPLAPQNGKHEVVGIVGEARGSYDGENLHHFHNGLDVQGAMGAPVLSVSNEKVSNPLPNGGFGSVGEGIGFDGFSYIHLRVGRTLKNVSVDPARFAVTNDDKGKPERVRVKRGTRFAVGDTLGTVNSMFHVHLVRHMAGGEANPLALPFAGLSDRVVPHIDAITLRDANGVALSRKAGKPVLVARAGGPLAIVAEAYDQSDGNAARRKLGLYKAGYQILHADGTPLPGYEQPLVNIEFNRLPPDRESVQVAYAKESGITVYGSATTRFLYVLTNVVRDGAARTGSWNPASLAPGDYLVRVYAADFAGNVALAGRDLPITVE